MKGKVYVANLVTVEVAAEILGSTKASLMVSACVYKKKHGEYPCWYVSNGKRGAFKSYVDVSVILQRTKEDYDAYEYGTNELWWELTEVYNANKLATIMSSRSILYPKFITWRAFFTKYLFSSVDRVKLTDKITMRQEFVIIGKQILEENKMK
jgi:hypothetical protein